MAAPEDAHGLRRLAVRLKLVPDTTRINFFSRWAMRFWLAVSAVGVVGSIVLFLTLGLNYGVDFRGGTLMMVATQEDVPVGDYRSLLNGLDFGEVNVTQVSDDTGQGRHMVLMRLGITGDDPDSQQAVITEIRNALTAQWPDIQFLQVDSVGAKVSGELVMDGILAVLLSFVGIMIYIWLRFEWQFALGAVASLIHDAILVVGVFALTRFEFNLTTVAAILTVIGYSINDTVVVFDRVREVLRKYKKMPLPEVMNLALNETLSRTVMTSLTTLIALVAIFLFGGSVVHGFAFAVIFGVLTGTYSSIYVASAVVLYFGVRRDLGSREGDGASKKRRAAA
jgi:preprotein translocase subunit SecF